MIGYKIFNRTDNLNLLNYLSCHVARTGEERGVYRVLVEKPEGKTPLGRPRRRWVDTIRMDLQEVEWVYGLDCASPG